MFATFRDMAAIGYATLIITIIANIVFIVICFSIVTLIFGNKHILKTNSSIITLLFIAFVSSVWKAYGILGYYTEAGIPPFGYAIAPYIYNLVTQFIFQCIFITLGMCMIFWGAKAKRPFLSIFILIVCLLPWLKLNEIVNPDFAPATNKNVSRKQMDDFGKLISAKIVGEQIYFDPKLNSKILRIKANIHVPQTGQYYIPIAYDTQLNQIFTPKYLLTPKLPPQYKLGNVFKGFGYEPDDYKHVFMNGSTSDDLKGIPLVATDNEVNFDFPVIVTPTRSKNTINRFFLDGVEGTYGPYEFQFAVNGFQPDTNGKYRFEYISPVYQTKTYTYEDLR